MLKSLKSNSYRFVVVLLLLLTFLTTGMVGKVIPSYALADPVIEYTQVYDTNIIQLSDYVENTLTESQGDIYYVLLGMFVYSQAAVSDYTLVDPYANESGVLSWLKSCGIQLHNTIIGFIPDNTIINVGNKAYNIGDLKPYLSGLVGYALGAATKASTYNSYTDFVDDVDNSDHWFMPYDKSLQIGVDLAFGLNRGLYNWQFTSSPFTTSVIWRTENFNSSLFNTYNYYYSMLALPRVRVNNDNNYYLYNFQFGLGDMSIYHNLFFDISTNQYYFVDDNGVSYSGLDYDPNTVYYNYRSNTIGNGALPISFFSQTFSFTPTNDVVNLVQSVFNSFYSSNVFYFLEDFVQHVYYGSSWSSKVEVFKTTDLNFYEVNSQYYLQVQNQYLLDIKGILNDLVNTVDLHTTLFNNLFNVDGTLNIDPSLIKVSVELPDITVETQRDPDLPVNLNDIELYTDNEYLTVVKERALQASDTIGEYVAFWHNCDSEFVYAVLGSFIIVLIGAFIGKWGHS